jgi:hypothetical protein
MTFHSDVPREANIPQQGQQMKASIFESKVTPAIDEAELAAQKAAFFANGGKTDYRQFGETAMNPIQTRREQNDENWKRSRVEITIGKRAQ